MPQDKDKNMPAEKNKTVLICCSIFKKAIEKIKNNNCKNNFDKIIFIDSMLHIYPEKLKEHINNAISKIDLKREKIGIIYGECHPFIDDNLYKRTNGINCIEIFLGSRLYKQLRKEGCFFLLPEWTLRWKEIFQVELGLSKNIAKSLMREMHKKIIYIDNEDIPVPYDKLKEISDYTGLIIEVIKISLDELESSINNLLERLK